MTRAATGKAPRIHVSLKPETYEIIREMSEASGASMSSVIAEFMEEAAPTLKNLTKTILVAKTKPKQAFDMLTLELAKAQNVASQVQLDLQTSKPMLKRRKAKNDESA